MIKSKAGSACYSHWPEDLSQQHCWSLQMQGVTTLEQLHEKAGETLLLVKRKIGWRVMELHLESKAWKCISEHVQGRVILVIELSLEAVEEDREVQQTHLLSCARAILMSVTYKKPSHMYGGEVTHSNITFAVKRYCIEYLISQKNHIQKKWCI